MTEKDQSLPTVRRKRGRPRLPEGENKDVLVSIRLTLEEHHRYAGFAAKENLSLSEWIRKALKNPT
jgi:hypothetical protein